VEEQRRRRRRSYRRQAALPPRAFVVPSACAAVANRVSPQWRWGDSNDNRGACALVSVGARIGRPALVVRHDNPDVSEDQPTGDFRRLMQAELGELDTRFAPNELAFLALTSKVEFPIRDRLAFTLSWRLKDSFLVAREWKSVDLAVLSPDAPHSPRMLIEVKSWYAFDLVGRSVVRVVQMARKDRAKLLGLPGLPSAAQLFVLVLATHPLSVVTPDLAQVAKYSAGISAAITRLRSADEVGRRASDTLAPGLSELGAIHAGTLEGGEAYGVPIQIRYWLVGPIDHSQT
jgi:hypothetical protein